MSDAFQNLTELSFHIPQLQQSDRQASVYHQASLDLPLRAWNLPPAGLEFATKSLGFATKKMGICHREPADLPLRAWLSLARATKSMNVVGVRWDSILRVLIRT